MNARVVTARFEPDGVGEAVTRYRSQVIPAAKQQQGYRGRLLLVNHDTGKALSITLWETEADMRANEDSGYLASQYASFQSLFAEPPQAERYEVSVNARPAPRQSVP